MMKKFRSRICVAVDFTEVQVGDYVEYNERGYRCGRVAKLIYKGRGKKRWLFGVQTEPMKYKSWVLRPAKKVDLINLQGVWRRRVDMAKAA